jgi:hypothetical protein
VVYKTQAVGLSPSVLGSGVAAMDMISGVARGGVLSREILSAGSKLLVPPDQTSRHSA